MQLAKAAGEFTFGSLVIDELECVTTHISPDKESLEN